MISFLIRIFYYYYYFAKVWEVEWATRVVHVAHICSPISDGWESRTF